MPVLEIKPHVPRCDCAPRRRHTLVAAEEVRDREMVGSETDTVNEERSGVMHPMSRIEDA